MSRSSIVLALSLAVLLPSVWGCAKPATETAHPAETGAGEEAAAPDRIALAQLRGVRFEPAGPPRQEGAWFAAEAVADSSAAAMVSAPVAGIVTALLARPGQAVRAGTPLVEIQSPELSRLEAAWLAARARQRRTTADLERERRLLAGAATSAREVEAAEAEAAVADAETRGAELELAARGVKPGGSGARLRVRAPRAGIVTGFEVTLGQGVQSGQTLGRLEAPGAALVRVELPLPGPESWAAGAATEVRGAEGRKWPARVEGVPPAVSNDTRRLVYRLRLGGGDLPLAGTPLEARVPLARAIVLPQSALQQIEGSWGVFVRTGDEARFRKVQKGPELGGDVLVLAGVSPGDAVATEGAYLLKSLLLKQAGGGEEHDH